MASASLLVWFAIILVPVLISMFHRKGNRRTLPPGPPGWPVFGNMFDLGTMPHRTLAAFRQKYGHIVWLNLGDTNTLVVLSTKAATELFKNHDLAFADRAVAEAMKAHDFDKGSVSLAPYGPHWRIMRRLCTSEMFSTKRINESVSLRRKCMDLMLSWVEQEALGDGVGEARRAVHLGKFVFLLNFNMLGNLMLSRDLVNTDSVASSKFFLAVKSTMEESESTNVSDFFPWLKWLDPQGLKRKMEKNLGKALEIASGFVEERLKEKQAGELHKERRDFLDVLLDYQSSSRDESEQISRKAVDSFVMEIFIAGSETASSTIEWAMTELLRHPEKMAKLKAELSQVAGNRKVEESDINELPYLQAVIKETLRLHPALPFLVPRRATQDIKFMGYDIPKNTQVFVNTWAIGRDPDSWDNAASFEPERFVGSKIDYIGQNYEFLPFGAGRRICAGLPLAHRVLHLVLGSLLQHFDWELEKHETGETIDMGETLGITMRKTEPLKAIPRKIMSY